MALAQVRCPESEQDVSTRGGMLFDAAAAAAEPTAAGSGGGAPAAVEAAGGAAFTVQLDVIQPGGSSPATGDPSSTQAAQQRTVRAVRSVSIAKRQVPSLKLAECVVTSKSPLIIRSGLVRAADPLHKAHAIRI